MQTDLFSEPRPEANSGFIDVPLADADVKLSKQWLPSVEAKKTYQILLQNICWSQPSIIIAGRPALTPRLQAWYGDTGTAYGYSGKIFEPNPWTGLLLTLKTQVEVACNAEFNSVLINWYRTGQDSVGWHADDEPELGPHPVIASLSLGDTRRFLMRLKNRRQGEQSLGLDLGAGDLLLMQGNTQQKYQHTVPKTARSVGGRINLTFRHVTGA